MGMNKTKKKELTNQSISRKNIQDKYFEKTDKKENGNETSLGQS